MPTDPERRDAHLKHILRTEDLIEALVQPQLLARVAASQPGSPADGPALTDAGGTYFLSVLEKVRHDYCDELRWNGNSGRLPQRRRNEATALPRTAGILTSQKFPGKETCSRTVLHSVEPTSSHR